MKKVIRAFCLLIFAFSSVNSSAGEIMISSPNKKIQLKLREKKDQPESWDMEVHYLRNEKSIEIIPAISIGLVTERHDFHNNLKLLKKSKLSKRIEQYTAIHGKSSRRHNEATEGVLTFANPQNEKLNLAIRVYNDGVCFRYELPGTQNEKIKILDETTIYQIPENTERWLQKFAAHYEGFYPLQKDKLEQGEWGYPCLFKSKESVWFLISEADIDRNYCATKLSNDSLPSSYKLTFPSASDGNYTGEIQPSIELPWKSPWRVLIIGELPDLVESTLIEDVSTPSKIEKTDWIIPGTASWIYWAYNHGTKDYKKVCEYVDLAARMGWPYTLFDWEWDTMSNGGNLEDAAKYAQSKGIKPMIWYNSGGPHTRVSASPRDRLLTPESRANEFTKLKEMGFCGIKVDFFESDKQNIMNYYIDLMEDAAKYELMINFHGSTVPRGWSRTYPHLISMEAVYGAEQYNNQPYMTTRGAEHNTILPFTRNVIGPMDYTPVAFTNSQHAHTTSYAHELALAVVFESAIQHMADRPEGFDRLPDSAKEFLRHLPTAWDQTKFLEGYPGKEILIARRKGEVWYVGCLNGENREKEISLNFSFLEKGKNYQLTLIQDGEHDSSLTTTYLSVNQGDEIKVKCLQRGGFSASLKAI